MTEASGFKHITVTSADEEDDIVHAGVTGARESGQANQDGFGAQDEPFTAGGSEVAGGGEEPSGSRGLAMSAPRAHRPSDHDLRVDGSRRSDTSSGASSGARREGAYHETTLDDLKPSPMPFMQKAIIIAAIILIIAALVYYFAAMR